MAHASHYQYMLKALRADSCQIQHNGDSVPTDLESRKVWAEAYLVYVQAEESTAAVPRRCNALPAGEPVSWSLCTLLMIGNSASLTIPLSELHALKLS